MERSVIKVLLRKDNYGKYRKLVLPQQVTRETVRILEALDDLHKSTTGDVSSESLYEYLAVVKYPTMSEEQKELYERVIRPLDSIDDPIGSAVIEALIEREATTRIADIASSIAEGTGVHGTDEIQKVLDEYHVSIGRMDSLDKSFVSVDITELYSSSTVHGFSWRLKELQKATGPIPVGTLVLAGARPESGKSTFLASECSHMAMSVPDDRTVLIVCNEEPGQSIQARFVQAALGMTKADILRDPVSAKRKFESLHRGRPFADLYKIYHNPGFGMYDLRRLAEKHEPAIIIVDQLRNVRGFEKRSSTEVERLKGLYGEARVMASEYGPVFTVHQAGGSAEGMEWIPGNMLEGCQTEVQGSLDVQIMIGKSSDLTAPNTRCLNVVKNKLTGCEDEEFRHGKFTVKINPLTSRYE